MSRICVDIYLGRCRHPGYRNCRPGPSRARPHQGAAAGPGPGRSGKAYKTWLTDRGEATHHRRRQGVGQADLVSQQPGRDVPGISLRDRHFARSDPRTLQAATRERSRSGVRVPPGAQAFLRSSATFSAVRQFCRPDAFALGGMMGKSARRAERAARAGMAISLRWIVAVLALARFVAGVKTPSGAALARLLCLVPSPSGQQQRDACGDNCSYDCADDDLGGCVVMQGDAGPACKSDHG